MMYRKPESSFFSGDFCRTPGGCADGFGSCTESLGSESSDERISDEELVQGRGGSEIGDCSTVWRRVRRRSEERRRVVELPPPMTSLDRNGRRSFVLRPVRKDGRLELTEVRICRPEIMRATRENGRLTLRLIQTPDEEEDEDEDEIEEEEEEEEEEETGDCGFQGGEGGGAPRRCYEYDVAGHHHLNVWTPRVVTTG